MNPSIFYKKGSLFIKIGLDDINYARAEGDYISLFLVKKESTLLRDSLTNIEKTINSTSFFRIHRSWLINLDKIDCLDIKGEWVEIAGQKIPISRSRRAAFLEKISCLG